VVTLPVALDQRRVGRLQRLGQPSGGDLGAHGFHPQRLTLVRRGRQRGDACRNLAGEPRVIGAQRLALDRERGAPFGTKS
jgi:hypothetical protein